MTKRTKTIVALALMLAVAAAALLCWLYFSPTAQPGGKSVAITIVHGDGSEKTLSLSTDEQTLRGALEQEELIEGQEGPYGLFVTTVDGEQADESQQQWWCFTKAGESLSTGVDDTMIADGDEYEITLTTGYDW